MVKRIFCFIAACCIFTSAFSQQVDYSQFKGKAVKVSIPIRLDQPYFCEYRDSTSSPIRLVYNADFSSSATPEDFLLSAYCGTLGGVSAPVYNGPKPDTTLRNGLMLIHKLTFFWQGVETSVVKFAEMKDSLVGQPYSIMLQHVGGTWKQVSLPEIRYIESTVLSIRTNIFWELYNKRSSEIPGVNEVRKVVKDEEGLLNIGLLSDFVNKERKKGSTAYNLVCDN